MLRQHLCSVMLFGTMLNPGFGGGPVEQVTKAGKVSYYQQVRPIFQANCQGCHQSAKASGDYRMTSFATVLRGGASGPKAIVPGRPEKSYLVEMITPTGGKAEMPQGNPPLVSRDIELVRRWIQEGAVDDTPPGAQQPCDMDHPPKYWRAPVITSLDYSPDGSLLAVAGFHEVLLLRGDGSRLVARLVGLSERIESVRFSRDGSKLLAVGGIPCRMGEVQVWDVPHHKLLLSLPVTSDTLYGGSWSPDGSLIAFGGADNAVRVVEMATSKQVVYMAAHEDWVRGTVFSADGKSLVSASRDMTVKLTDVATQRFLGNVTTHTPGLLRGGMTAVDRRASRNEVLVGSADGAPKLFQMDVKAAPAGGGNPNQIREYEALTGRVFDVRFHPDGTRLFAASSLDGKGQVRAYETETGKRLWQLDVAEGGIFALACSPDGLTLAAAGADGQIRLIDTLSGRLRKSFLPIEFGSQHVAIPVQVNEESGNYVPSFVRDIQPILSRMGCNAGTCHGAAKGKNGFKLSLRGYDAVLDHRALTDDLASRRVNMASPDDSLMLLKPTATVPHQGGRLMSIDSRYYHTLRRWIAEGARLDLSVPRVTKIELFPRNPTINRIGSTQQMRVVAAYADGTARDVTREAFIESGNTETALADRSGLLTATRRGETPVLRRVRRVVCRHHAHSDGGSDGLQLEGSRDLEQARRIGCGEMATDEDPSLAPFDRRRILAPRVPGPDGAPAHGGRGADLSDGQPRHWLRNAIKSLTG